MAQEEKLAITDTITPMIRFVVRHGEHHASLDPSSDFSVIAPSDAHIGVSLNCASLLHDGLMLSGAAYPEGGGATIVSPRAPTLAPQAAPPGFLAGDPVIVGDGRTVLFEIGDGRQEDNALYRIELRLTIGPSTVDIPMDVPCRAGD